MLKKTPEIVAEARISLQTLTAIEAKEKYHEIGGVVLDVREPAEYQAKAAKGTVNVPRGILESKMPELYSDEKTPIFIHCASGARATFAAEQLQRIGYENVWVITCGIDQVVSSFD
ncbi:rhodanese-like domain-containing protein [Colwellia sp. MEBiC06753]